MFADLCSLIEPGGSPPVACPSLSDPRLAGPLMPVGYRLGRPPASALAEHLHPWVREALRGAPLGALARTARGPTRSEPAEELPLRGVSDAQSVQSIVGAGG